MPTPSNAPSTAPISMTTGKLTLVIYAKRINSMSEITANTIPITSK